MQNVNGYNPSVPAVSTLMWHSLFLPVGKPTVLQRLGVRNIPRLSLIQSTQFQSADTQAKSLPSPPVQSLKYTRRGSRADGTDEN